MIAWSDYFKSYIRLVTFSSHDNWTFMLCDKEGKWDIKKSRPMKANSSYYDFKWEQVTELTNKKNIEKLELTKQCLNEILESKMNLEEENDLQNSVSYGLNLSIRSLKEVIEIIDDKLENYR